MLLDMAADGLGDRVAIGSRTDGLSYEALRRAASGVARSPRRHGRHDAGADPAERAGAPGRAVRRRVGRGELRPGELPPPRRGAGRDDRPARSPPSSIDDDAPWLAAGAGPGSARPSPTTPTAPAVLLFTSGTSAAPKAAVLEHDQLLAYIFNTVEFAAAERRRGRAARGAARSTSRASPPC